MNRLYGRREDATQTIELLKLFELTAKVLLKGLVPLCELRRLSLDGVLILLDTQQRPHATEQFARIERSSNEVVGACLDGCDFVLVSTRRQHDHWEQSRRGVGADSATDLVATDVRHQNVEEDDIRFAGADFLETFGA